MDACAWAMGLGLCAGLGVLAWWIDPAGRSAAGERAWRRWARDRGLGFRSKREPMGPRVMGTWEAMSVEVDLAGDAASQVGPNARVVVGDARDPRHVCAKAAGARDLSAGFEGAFETREGALSARAQEALVDALRASGAAQLELCAGAIWAVWERPPEPPQVAAVLRAAAVLHASA